MISGAACGLQVPMSLFSKMLAWHVTWLLTHTLCVCTSQPLRRETSVWGRCGCVGTRSTLLMVQILFLDQLGFRQHQAHTRNECGMTGVRRMAARKRSWC